MLVPAVAKIRVPELPPFGGFDVVERDRQAIGGLSSTLSDLLLRLFGNRAVVWNQETELFTEILYVYVTTLLGAQTLGEEKVGVIQTENFRKLPSFARSLAANLTPATFSYAVNKLLSQLEERLIAHSNTCSADTREAEETRSKLRRIGYMRALVDLISRIHFALLLLGTQRTPLVKRLFGIRYIPIWPLYAQYVSTAEDSNLNAPRTLAMRAFRVLGVATLLDVLLRSGFLLRYALHLFAQPAQKHITSPNSVGSGMPGSRDDTTSSSSPGLRCAVCLERCKDISATPCGHVACWMCLNEWVQRHKRCAICQTPIDNANRIVFLQNLD